LLELGLDAWITASTFTFTQQTSTPPHSFFASSQLASFLREEIGVDAVEDLE
jgi:hypothetical protein